MKQETKILSHMITFGSITPAEAYENYGVLRLASRIYDLKKAGHGIVKTIEVGYNRYGERVKYARYELK